MFSKKKTLLIFVILLSLCLCISAISAEDISTDENSVNLHSTNEDSIQSNVNDNHALQSSDEGMDVKEESSKASLNDEYEVTPDNFYDYFTTDGTLTDNETVLPSGSTLCFVGTFDHIVNTITINRPVSIIGSEDGKIKDMSFMITSSGITLNGLNLVYSGAANADNKLINAIYANDLIIKDNVISFVGNGAQGFFNHPIWITNSTNVIISGNIMDVTVPSDDRERNPVTNLQTVRDGGIFAEFCDCIEISGNLLNITPSAVYGTYDTIHGITVVNSVNATVKSNNIKAKGKKYFYGIYIAGNVFIDPETGEKTYYPASNYYVGNNYLDITGEYYANGINIDNLATGLVNQNNMAVKADNVTYAIYTNTWAGKSYNNITYNYIFSEANSVYCMELMATGERVIGNVMVGNGNFVMGIGCADGREKLDIIDNYIYCNGTGEGTPTGGDLSIQSSNIGIVSTKCPIYLYHNFIFTKSSNYTINLEDTNGSIVKYNYLVADNKIEENTINATGNNTIEDNTNLDEFEITQDNINLYMNNETGTFYNNIPEGAKITFTGTFENINFKRFVFNRMLNIYGNNTIFKNIFVSVKAPFVNITNICIQIDSLSDEEAALSVEGEGVSITNSIFNFNSANNVTAMAVNAVDALNFKFTNNQVYFKGNGFSDNINYAFRLNRAVGSIIEGNNFTILIPSADIEYLPPLYQAILIDGGIVIEDSDNVTVKNNNINLEGYEKYTSTGFDTIYVIDVMNSDGLTFTNNNVTAIGQSYIYGLVVSGEDFNIANNIFNITGTVYANGLDFTGTVSAREPDFVSSSGNVTNNNLNIFANNVTYPIYSNDWTGGAIIVNYINNNIVSKANSVYGMELTGTIESVIGNNMTLDGNFTTGIGIWGKHINLTIENNQIICRGEGSGSPTKGDTYIPSTNVGIIIVGNSTSEIIAYINNNFINTTGKYGVNLTQTTNGTVESNEIYAKSYTGGAAVYEYYKGKNIIQNNIPLMNAVLNISASNSTLPGDNLLITVTGLAGEELIENGQMSIDVLCGDQMIYSATVSVIGGKAIIAIPSISVGEYTISATYTNPDYNPASAQDSVNITDHYTLAVKDLSTYYKYNQYLVATLSKNNVACPGQEVVFNIAGKVVTATTDANGQVKSLVTDYTPNTYKVTVSSNGVSKTVTVKIGKSPVKFTSVTKSVKKGKYFQLKVLTGKNKPIAKQTVIIKIGNKKFTAKTSSSGIAKVKVNLAPKKYKVTYQLQNNKYYESTKKSSTLIVKK